MRGAKLWELQLYADATREINEMRVAVAEDPVASYQLALHLRDLGAFRQSIQAANATLILSGEPIFEAPALLGRLIYPVYYADLVLSATEKYGIDPLLQFALIRQESLFESFAASPAAAQGLSQIIPDTGVFIAQRLNWPNYSNEDLYRPYINVNFGAYYLDQQLRTFNGNVAAALSAYNAGPGQAAKWHAAVPNDHDLYLETVNFAETRLYIRNIYIGHAVYRWLYGEN